MKEGSGQTFSKDRRVRKRREFLRIQETGSRVTLPSAIVLLSARPDEGPARLGVTVTRKFGNAVARNRAKRVFRELFRRSGALLPPGIDFVVIPKASVAGSLTLPLLVGEWTRAAGLLGARADSLRRALAKGPPAPHNPKPRGSRR
ncbi:MAG: ribonuclease P protein component [Polyangiaceae bacterium]